MVALPEPDLWVEPVQVHYGDVWQLGQHRLMCGDATKEQDVAALMQGERAQAIITDPPYGEICASWDSVTLDFIPFLVSYLDKQATIAIFCSLPFGFDLHAAMLKAGYQWRWDVIWAKRNGGPMTSKFTPRNSHEHIFTYAHKKAPISSLCFNGYDAGEQKEPWARTPSRRKSEVYAESFLPGKAGEASGKRWIRTLLDGREKIALPYSERTTHPTQKPLEVVEKLVLLLTHENQVVYDPFLGSGTTLIAGQNTKRAVYGMELSPTYCSDIIQRWQRLTGVPATLAIDKEYTGAFL